MGIYKANLYQEQKDYESYLAKKKCCLVILIVCIDKFDIFKTRRLEYRQNEGQK